MSGVEFEYHPKELELDMTPGVRFMSRLPRFSHSSDFSKLASSDQDEQTDYVLGILAVSFFILSAFIFWGAVVITCKCMGKRRVGLCAGRAHVVSDPKGKFKPPTYLWKLRLFFISLGCCIILLSVALVGPGLRSIDSMQVSTRKLNRDVKDLITQGLLIMESVKRVRWNVEALDVPTILGVEEACPNLRGNTFMSDKTLRKAINGVDRDFNELKTLLEEADLETIRGHIANIQVGTEYIDVAITTVEKNDWIVRMFALVLNVLVFFLILGACLSSKCTALPALNCMSELFILPMFVVAIVGSWVATSILALASISNADFCSGTSEQAGPAGTVMGIFEERGLESDDIIFSAFSYYQSECATEDPINHLYQYEDDLQSGIGSANDFLTQVDEIGLDEINEQCGASVYPIVEGIGLIKDNLGILLGALRSTYELASCRKMSPIYQQAFEGTACTDSSGSLTLIFSIMFAISFVGMVMIMLRGAVYPFKRVYRSSSFDDEEQDEWEEYQAYLQYMASFVNLWGGSEDAVSITKQDTPETSTASSKSTANTQSNTSSSFLRTVEASWTMSSNEDIPDEETPISPQTATLDGSSIHKGRDQDEIHEEEEKGSYGDEELRPLSPDSNFSPDSRNLTVDQSRMYSPVTKQRPDGDSDDFNDDHLPFTPQNPISHTSGGGLNNRRFRTPDFLTPGRFTMWRQQNAEDDVDDDGIPATPLITSPRNDQHEGANYLGSIISPLRSPVSEENRTVKID